MTAYFWTPDKIDRLRELFAQGLPYQAIGDEFGKTEKVICEVCRQNGLQRALRNRPVPDNFAELGPTMFIREASRFWRADVPTIARWHTMAGTTPKTRAKQIAEQPAKPASAPRSHKAKRQPSGTPWLRTTVLIVDDHAAGRAQRELQRLVGPCFKVSTRNLSDTSGDYFVAGKRMTAQAMIEMAEAKLKRAA